MHNAVSAAMSDLWDFAGDTGTFTPVVGSPSADIQIRIDREILSGPDGVETVVTDEEIRAKMLLSDIGGVIPVPLTPTRAGDEITIGSDTYEITGIVDQDNHFVTCAVREA